MAIPEDLTTVMQAMLIPRMLEVTQATVQAIHPTRNLRQVVQWLELPSGVLAIICIVSQTVTTPRRLVTLAMAPGTTQTITRKIMAMA